MIVEQRSQAWLTAASPNEIVAAQKSGELDELMGVVRNAGGNTAEQMRGLRYPTFSDGATND